MMQLEKQRGTGPNVRHGGREADRTSAGKVVYGDRFTAVRISQQSWAKALSPPGVQRLDQHPEYVSCFCNAQDSVLSEVSKKSCRSHCGHCAENRKPCDEETAARRERLDPSMKQGTGVVRFSNPVMLERRIDTPESVFLGNL
jgi:hypothetical protein